MNETEMQIERLNGEIKQAEARLTLVPYADHRTTINDRIALEFLKFDRDKAVIAKNITEAKKAPERKSEILAELGRLKKQLAALSGEMRNDPANLENNIAIINRIHDRADEIRIELARLENQGAVQLRELSELKSRDRNRFADLRRALEHC